MCAGAIVNARIARLVFGARDLRFGGVRSKFRIADSDVLNHRVEIVEGVLAVECVELLREFFAGEDRRRRDTEKIFSLCLIVEPEHILFICSQTACWITGARCIGRRYRRDGELC